MNENNQTPQELHDEKVIDLSYAYQTHAGQTAVGAIEKIQEIIISMKTNEVSFSTGLDLIREVSTTNLLAVAIATASNASH